MKLNLTNSITTIFLIISLVLFSGNFALADTVKSNTRDTLQQAAKEVVKDTGVKEQFGKTKKGDRLLDQAQEKANQKLNNLADKSDRETELPKSQKLFLKNLTNQS